LFIKVFVFGITDYEWLNSYVFYIYAKAKPGEVFMQFFKCAIGACYMSPHGLRVCKDGPVFNGELLVDSGFGEYKKGGVGLELGFKKDVVTAAGGTFL
jgi:hypothetical protein